MRRPIIAGNWKMNKTPSEAIDFIAQLKPLIADISDIDIVIAPPFTALQAVSREIEGSNITLGAQNVFWEASGAFTGEVSPPMVREVGCRYVIIGHSERRQYFGETNESVRKKIEASLAVGLSPIVCVGEALGEREAGKTFDVVRVQVSRCLEGFSREEMVFFVLDAIIQKTTLEQTLRAVFNRHREQSYHLLGVEDNLFQRLLLKEFDQMGRELGVFLPVKGVTHRLAKETRVASVSPLLERGKIRFIRGHSDQEKLIEQLLYFPSRTLHDDGPDALAGAVQLVQTMSAGKTESYVPLKKRAFGGRGAF